MTDAPEMIRIQIDLDAKDDVDTIAQIDAIAEHDCSNRRSVGKKLLKKYAAVEADALRQREQVAR